jgi:putative N6-adenine-specific DNA methylase
LETFDIVAKTLFGLEEVLKNEIENIGGTDIEILSRAVKFKGNQALLYKSNLHLRTAIKILKPIDSFLVTNEEQLYKRIKTINWGEYITENQTFAIDGTTSGEVFKHSKYIALKTKDAIADQFREKTGVRPSVNTDDPDLRINVQISGTKCNVSLDSSGFPLGKRGYRLQQVLAPISENLAAGMILLSNWDKKSDFLDPMCGSGTIPIEAAMIARNIAPGRLRSFAFEKWKDFAPYLWKRLKNEAEARIIPFKGKIYGHDIDIEAIRFAALNAQNAKVDDIVDIDKKDFFASDFEIRNGIIMINPPYGERLNEQDEIIPMYQEIGTKLKHSFEGCDAWIISGNLNAIKFIGLKPSKKINLFNGPIECKFHKFELYKGSKKTGEIEEDV